MAVYQTHILRETQRARFRSAAHSSGLAVVRKNDYEPGATVEAPTVYAAWTSLRDSAAPLQVGDLLETPSGELQVCKFIGFEDACWWVAAPAVPLVDLEASSTS